MEDSLPNTIWPLRILSYSLWPGQRPRILPEHDQQCPKGLPRSRSPGLSGRHPYILKGYERTCDSGKEGTTKTKRKPGGVAAHKSIFHTTEVEFLGYMVNQEGLRMSNRKIESISTWETPKKIKDIQRFLGFANYYRRFIKDFLQSANL